MGKIIRSLRTERGLTQNGLAEKVGVTAQAVSKWENEVGFPDVSQIVPLSGALGVCTDVLFGLEPNGIEAALKKKIAQEKEEDCNAGQSIELWSEFLERYPKCAEARFRLASAYLKRQVENDFEKAAEQFERILDESTDEKLRYKSLDLLCFCYVRMGDTESAVRIAERCPPFQINFHVLLAKIYGYEKQEEINMDLMFNCLNEVCWCIKRAKYQSNETRLVAYNKALQAFRLFSDYGDRFSSLCDKMQRAIDKVI